MNRTLLLAFCVSHVLLFSCKQEPNKPIDIQGHRGARGLMPENSIPGFIKAVKLGVNTLEMDLSVTKDSVLVVSHEPYFSHDFCQDTTGERISKDRKTNIYQMRYAEIVQYDCGSIPHPRFPGQEKISVYKPKLTTVLDTVERFAKSNELPEINYNIELKTTLETDDIYHPTPEVFSEIVFSEIKDAGILNRTTIQSFDFRTLQYFDENYPEVKLALLIANELPWQENIDSLGFTPEIYSCYYQLLSREIIEELQQNGMYVIPWTINETSDMKNLIDWGVDGIITDYPDRLVKLINEK